MAYYGFRWRPYVSVAKRRQSALRRIKELSRQGHVAQPVTIDGRVIARTFWGQAWCDNLESYSDYSNRMPRGRTYVRNGSVVDLQIAERRITALVSGSELYEIEIRIKQARKDRWQTVKQACLGKIDSVVELLQGRLSQGVMQVLTAREGGLFPSPQEIELKCSCPDWASMCKHVAAVLYGVGARLDTQPDLLFLLRAVDANELIAHAAAGSLGAAANAPPAMADDELSRVFGIELDATPRERAPVATGAATTTDEPRKLNRNDKALIRKRLASLRAYLLEHEKLTTAEYRLLFGLTPAATRHELTLLRESWYLIRETPRRYCAGVALG